MKNLGQIMKQVQDMQARMAEMQEKLARVRPETLGQAGRIPGVTPAAISILDVYLRLTQ